MCVCVCIYKCMYQNTPSAGCKILGVIEFLKKHLNFTVSHLFTLETVAEQERGIINR